MNQYTNLGGSGLEIGESSLGRSRRPRIGRSTSCPRRALQDTHVNVVIAAKSRPLFGGVSGPAHGATGVQQVQRPTEYRFALRPYAAGGYINFMMDEGGSGGCSTYRDNYDRVALVKAKYGAENFLSTYRNISPAATSAAV
jgi:hypothetical protein